MKCPSCGADIPEKAKLCEFCGSQISYEMQKEQERVNKQGCPNCESTNISFSREKQGEIRGKKGTAVMRATVGCCKDCGYTWQAQSEYDKPKKNNMWLWVLGWLCFFPIPLTIVIWRSKMKSTVKYVLIGILWLFVLIMGFAGNSGESSNSRNSGAVTNNNVIETSDVATDSASAEENSSIEREPSSDDPQIAVTYNVNEDNGKVLFGVFAVDDDDTRYNVIVTNEDGYKATDTVTILKGAGYTAEFSTAGSRENGDVGEGLKGNYTVTVTDMDGKEWYSEEYSF